MKRAILIYFSLAVLTVFSANAQLRIGIRAGVNASTFEGIENLPEMDRSASYKPGFHVGISAQMIFGMLGLESGLYYSMLGAKEKSSETVQEYYADRTNTYTAPYLQLPVSLLIKFNLAGSFAIYPSAGLYLGYGLGSGKVSHELSSNFPTDVISSGDTDFFGDGDDAFKRFDMGYTLGLNVDIAKFTVGVGFDYGFMKINKREKEIVLTEDQELSNWKNGNIKLSLGVYF